jgi:hypothetical protein
MKKVLIAIFALAVFFGILAYRLPLTLVTERLPITYSAAEGTVWQGRLYDLATGGQPVGDLRFRAHPFSLLGGEPRAHFDLSGRGIEGRGVASASADSVILEDADLSINLGITDLRDPLGRPLEGSLDLDIGRLAFGRQLCEAEAVLARTDALEHSLGAFSSRGFPLAGEALCEGERLVLPLSGGGDDADIALRVEIDPAGSYSTELTVTPATRELGQYLAGLGFVREGPAYSQTREGRFRTVWP